MKNLFLELQQYKKCNFYSKKIMKGCYYYCEEIFIPEQDNSLDLPLTFQQYKWE